MASEKTRTTGRNFDFTVMSRGRSCGLENESEDKGESRGGDTVKNDRGNVGNVAAKFNERRTGKLGQENGPRLRRQRRGES